MDELQQSVSVYETEHYPHGDLTERIIGIFYDIYNTLGYGFLERVYQNAMMIRLRKAGFSVLAQHPIHVHFDGVLVGEYFADMVVDDKVILELKANQQLTTEHQAQLLNYLKATSYEVGLLLNFGARPEIIRKAYDNHRKPNLHADHADFKDFRRSNP